VASLNAGVAVSMRGDSARRASSVSGGGVSSASLAGDVEELVCLGTSVGSSIEDELVTRTSNSQTVVVSILDNEASGELSTLRDVDGQSSGCRDYNISVERRRVRVSPFQAMVGVTHDRYCSALGIGRAGRASDGGGVYTNASKHDCGRDDGGEGEHGCSWE